MLNNGLRTFRLKSMFMRSSFSFSHKFNYDYFVIGGGSGGLASAKEAALYNKKVAVADYIVPSPYGSKWGLGGTCVNVGCIPKKLYHIAGLKYEELDNYSTIGINIDYPKKIISNSYSQEEQVKALCDWNILKDKIQQYIKKLNFGHRSKLREKNITYYNKFAKFIDNHTLLLTDSKGVEEIVTADKILVSVGGRPNYGEYKGSKEFCITSDDIFSLNKPPGKTLVVGASYIALECAGFLNSLGYPTSVMVRSKLLRGFDNDMSDRIGIMMKNKGVNFIENSIPLEFSKASNERVITKYININDQSTKEEEYDTVILAIGREAITKNLNLDKLSVKVNPKNSKIIVDDKDKSSIDNIYSIGDCADNRPELTPPAIRAGRLLSQRLFNNSDKNMNYNNIATTVFTPLEYSCVGYSEEDAKIKYGEDKIKVYHSEFSPLEWTLLDNYIDNSYAKVIVNSNDNNRVVGMHLLSPNAGEIIQGFSAAINCGLTKEQLDDTVSIHPTSAEEITLLKIDKEIGDGKKEDC